MTYIPYTEKGEVFTGKDCGGIIAHLVNNGYSISQHVLGKKLVIDGEAPQPEFGSIQVVGGGIEMKLRESQPKSISDLKLLSGQIAAEFQLQRAISNYRIQNK